MAKLREIPGRLKSMWRRPPPGRYLTLKEIAGYGLSGLGISSIYSALQMVLTIVYIPYFYKIAAIHGYIISFAAGVCGVLFQPVLGRLMEKSNTRWGKYKPFVLFLSPIMTALCVLVMWTPQFSIETSRTVYAYFVCIPAMFLGTTYNNLYYMFPAVMTPISQERTDMMSPCGLLVGFIPSVISVVLPLLRSYFLNREYIALRIVGAFSAVIGLVLSFFILGVRERVFITAESGADGVTVREGVRLILKNKPMLILSAALTLGCMRDFIGIYFTLIMQLRFGATLASGLRLSGVFSLLLGFGATIAMVLLPFLSRKISNKRLFLIWAGIAAVCNGVVGLIGVQRIPVGLPTLLALGILRFIVNINALGILIPVMVGELYDYQQYLTGRRLEGYIQTAVYQTVALLTQFAMLGMGFLQIKVGFEQAEISRFVSGASGGASALPDALQDKLCGWINISYLVSAFSGALMFIALCFYPLNAEKYAEVMRQLAAKAVGDTFDGAEGGDGA